MANAKPAQATKDTEKKTEETTAPETKTREDGVRVTELPGGTIREDY